MAKRKVIYNLILNNIKDTFVDSTNKLITADKVKVNGNYKKGER